MQTLQANETYSVVSTKPERLQGMLRTLRLAVSDRRTQYAEAAKDYSVQTPGSYVTDNLFDNALMRCNNHMIVVAPNFMPRTCVSCRLGTPCKFYRDGIRIALPPNVSADEKANNK